FAPRVAEACVDVGVIFKKGDGGVGLIAPSDDHSTHIEFQILVNFCAALKSQGHLVVCEVFDPSHLNGALQAVAKVVQNSKKEIVVKWAKGLERFGAVGIAHVLEGEGHVPAEW